MKEITATGMPQNDIITDFTFPDFFDFPVDADLYTSFLKKACANTGIHQVIISFPFRCDDPLRWMYQQNKKQQFSYFWEKPAEELSMAATGSIHELSSEGPGRFDTIRQALAEVKAHILHLDLASPRNHPDPCFLGGFSFWDDIDDSAWTGFEGGSFTLPEYLVVKQNNGTMVSLGISLNNISDPQSLHNVIADKLRHLSKPDGQKARSSHSTARGYSNGSPGKNSADERHHWLKLVADAKQKIEDQKFDKVVLGRQLRLKLPRYFNTFKVLERLRTQYPHCTIFYIKKKNSNGFIGSSPELLLSVKNNRVNTEALAGTIARGNNTHQDKRLENDLVDSVKNQEEHGFVVNYIKKLLTPLVDEVQAAARPNIKKLANVQHLYSPIKGTVKQDISPLTILGQLHPTPAVGGTPASEALTYIRQNEPFNRGWFASPIGWITTGGEAEFTVAIRSGLIGDQSAQLFAGCGIVADSDPEEEWKETNLKFMPMLSALNYD